MEPVILIPAFQPGDALVRQVRDLRERSPAPIVVVDDGSATALAPVFRAVAAVPGVTVLSHRVNRGKGKALRTAMEHVLAFHERAPGVVTADADGQHAVEDILRVAEVFRAHPDALVLGVRQFTAAVPFRNRMGNRITRRLLRLVAGVSLSDAHTGLRGIPRAWLAHLVVLRSMRYEFEMEVLLWASAHSVEVLAHPIQTLYGGSVSHFAPVVDSARIGLILARFAAASAAARWSGRHTGARSTLPAQAVPPAPKGRREFFPASQSPLTRHTISPSDGRWAGKKGSGPYTLE